MGDINRGLSRGASLRQMIRKRSKDRDASDSDSSAAVDQDDGSSSEDEAPTIAKPIRTMKSSEERAKPSANSVTKVKPLSRADARRSSLGNLNVYEEQAKKDARKNRRRRLKRMMKAWTRTMNNPAAIKTKYTRQAFAHWKETANALRICRKYIRNIIVRREQRGVISVFESWMKILSDKRTLFRVYIKWKRSAFKNSFYAWIDYIEECRVQQQVLEQRKVWMKCLRVNAASHCQYQQKKILRASRYFMRKSSAAAFRKWDHVAANLKYWRAKLETFVHRIRNQDISRAIQSWKHNVKFIRSFKRRYRKFTGACANNNMHRAFTRWNGCLDGKHRAKRTALRFLKYPIAKSFNRWKNLVRQHRRHSVVISRVSKRIMMKDVAKAMTRWREFTTTQVSAWRTMSRVVKHWNNKALAESLHQWVGIMAVRFERRRKKLLVLSMIFRRKEALCFQTWAYNVLGYSGLRCRFARYTRAKYTRRFLYNDYFCGWNTWLSYIEDRRRMRSVVHGALTRWRCESLTKGWNKWRRVLRNSRVLESSIRRWRFIELTQAMEIWFSWHDRRVSYKAMNVVDRIRMKCDEKISRVHGYWEEVMYALQGEHQDAIYNLQDEHKVAKATLQQEIADFRDQLGLAPGEKFDRIAELEALLAEQEVQMSIRTQAMVAGNIYKQHALELQRAYTKWKFYASSSIDQKLLKFSVVAERAKKWRLREFFNNWIMIHFHASIRYHYDIAEEDNKRWREEARKWKQECDRLFAKMKTYVHRMDSHVERIDRKLYY